MTYYLGVDIGGTFTDSVAVDDHGRIFHAKTPSTHVSSPVDAVLTGLDLLAEAVGVSTGELCADADRLGHGTTIGTNLIVERAQLRAAHEQLTSIGMEAFAEGARRELVATGERVHRRTVETRDDLTAQERQVALLARDGLSNVEIGARLFLSQHIVAYHLRKVFSKLGISSRRELAASLPSFESALLPA
jgi:N-methylhydantoinase A/oxoprolinase/acetone carboxylase beta subunit